MQSRTYTVTSFPVSTGMQPRVRPWTPIPTQACSQCKHMRSVSICYERCSKRRSASVSMQMEKNERQQERDMYEQDQPHLPDGRRLIFRLQGTHILPLDAQEKKVA